MSTDRKPSRLLQRRVWIFAGLIVVAAAFRLAVVHWLPNDTTDDSLGYEQIARNVLEHHVYSHATEAPFAPSFVRLPGYPLFVAAIYAVFGHTNNTAVRIAQALIDTGTCALVAWLAFLWQPDERRKIRTAIAALALAAVNPFTTIYAALILTEVPATFLIVAACVAATLAFRSDAFEWELRYWSISGLLLGLCVLFRPDAGLVAASMGITLVAAGIGSFAVRPSGGGPEETPEQHRRSVLRVPSKFARTILAGAVFSLAFILVLAPWTIRNWRTFHVFQPLAPRHAEMPGEFVAIGYERWLKTWMIDNEYLDEFLWEIDKQQVDVDELPDSAFDSQAERDRVEELFDDYNRPSNDSSDDEDAQPTASPSPTPAGPAAKQSLSNNANSNSENSDQDEPDNESTDNQPEKPGEMTPEIDAGFAQIANERIARHPFRYYFLLPARRAHSLWFNTHSDFYPFDGNALPLNNPDHSPGQNFWLPVFAVIVAIYTLVGIAGFIWVAMSGAVYARAVVLMIFLIFATRLALFSMAVSVEPRYVVEFFPFLSAAGGIAIAEILTRLRRTQHA